MGVGIECLVAGAGSAAEGFAAVERELERLEQIFSRFRPDSELSRLNEAGAAVCGDDLLAVVGLALAARERTGGRFDPTVHDALVAAGYDRTFAELGADDAASPAPPGPCGGEVRVDSARRLVRLAAGVRLDLGGIVKGYAAERACDLLHAGGRTCLVNAAGDIAVRGVPDEGCWVVGAATPAGEVTLGLTRGGLATSGRDLRRWRRDGEERHHLIDPATGRPSASDLLRVTVVAADAVEAEVHAKALFLAGEAAAAAEADRLGVPSVLVTGDGRSVLAGGLA
jgi:thiamine biosynthesis lipoprotein